MYTAVERAAEAVAGRVQHQLEAAYGRDWLSKVNARRRSEGREPRNGLGDPRFVMTLVAYEPALSTGFDDRQRQAAKRLTGMGNAAVHQDPPLPPGAGRKAEELANRLGADPQQTRPARQTACSAVAPPLSTDPQGHRATHRGPPATRSGWGFSQFANYTHAEDNGPTEGIDAEELLRLLRIHESRAPAEIQPVRERSAARAVRANTQRPSAPSSEAPPVESGTEASPKQRYAEQRHQQRHAEYERRMDELARWQALPWWKRPFVSEPDSSQVTG